MGISKRVFGKTPQGEVVHIYTLTNSSGMTAEITNFGGIIVSLKAPDSKGNFEDIILGYDNLEDYITKNGTYFGAIIGRCANRIGNAKFKLNHKEYCLAKNDGNNHLHGGNKGFDKIIWNSEIKVQDNTECLKLTYLSYDGEEGYPGNLKVKVIYTLTEGNELKIEYSAISDKDTVVNLTNHAYFNLSGNASLDILKHKVMINADTFTANDEESIPTGEIRNVKGTPMDFRELTSVEKGIYSDYDQIVWGKGYDHNYILNGTQGELKMAAKILDEKSGRVLKVFTTKPAVQFYTGNYLNSTFIGKGGTVYNKRNGLCVEAQYFPNAINCKNFPSPVLRKGEIYSHTTIYKLEIGME